MNKLGLEARLQEFLNELKYDEKAKNTIEKINIVSIFKASSNI